VQAADLKVRCKVGYKAMADGRIEIITGRERRRRWSIAEKLRLVAESEAPGASVTAVAARHDVYPGLLFTWRRQAREGRLSAEAMAEFVPVRVVDAPDQPGSALPEAAAPESARSAPLPSRPTPIEVVLPDGCQVRVGQDARPALLRAVLGALRG
jgi:transposase